MQSNYDLIIKNAKIIDGSGRNAFAGKIAVKDGIICRVEDNDAHINEVNCKCVYDAHWNVLSPGFIDIHCHTDETIFNYPKAEGKILQGVTTDMSGNCGISMAPLGDNRDIIKQMQSDAPYNWSTFGEFLDRVTELKPSVNFASGVGHGTIRAAVMGYDARKPDPDELEKMRKLLSDSIDAGAFQFSSGLIYPPGMYAEIEELSELCKVAAHKGIYYSTHMRNENLKITEAINEAVQTALNSGVSLEISHHKLSQRKVWGMSEKTLSLIENYRNTGLDIWLDQYPYDASSTNMSSNIPGWALDGGISMLVSRVKDLETKDRILFEMKQSHEGRWQDIVLGYAQTERFREMTGKNMVEIAGIMNTTPEEACLECVLAEGNTAMEVNFGMCEEDIERIMKDPHTMICSDGWAYDLDYPGLPHPRSFGTFPRVLGTYCRERRIIKLEEAVYKMTGLPAKRAGFEKRGLVKEGYFADLVIFDPDTVNDDPDYSHPCRACSGIKAVWVNGVLTALNGCHTGARAGMVIRKNKQN